MGKNRFGKLTLNQQIFGRLYAANQFGSRDCKSTVSHRALALEHAQDRLAFFFKELPSARIREAPQLPVVWQISRSLRNP